MKGFIFKISPENQEDTFREILLPENLNFEDFHFALLDAFEIDAGEMASFYLSDENWEKHAEITLMDMGMSEEGNTTALMNRVLLNKIMRGNQKRLLYIYDFLFCKNFRIELTGVKEEENIEPMLLASEGKYEVDHSGLTDLLLDELNLEEEGKPKQKKKDDIMEGFDDFDTFQDGNDEFDDPQFENIDDYDL